MTVNQAKKSKRRNDIYTWTIRKRCCQWQQLCASCL